MGIKRLEKTCSECILEKSIRCIYQLRPEPLLTPTLLPQTQEFHAKTPTCRPDDNSRVVDRLRSELKAFGFLAAYKIPSYA